MNREAGDDEQPPPRRPRNHPGWTVPDAVTSQEYKDQAVILVLDSGRSFVEVAKSIGVHEMMLGKWVKKARESGRVPVKDLSEPAVVQRDVRDCNR